MLLLEVSLVLTVKVFTLLLRSALGSIVSEKGGFTVVLRLLDLKLEFVKHVGDQDKCWHVLERRWKELQGISVSGKAWFSAKAAQQKGKK